MADTAATRCLRLATWLLSQSEPVSRERIYAAFADDYKGNPEAREKKFTRDKNALKRLGYHLQVLEQGRKEESCEYLLNSRTSLLPELDFEPDEAALLWAAGASALRLSDHPLREELESALRKLIVGAKGLPPRAAGAAELTLEGDLAPSLSLFDALADAWESRKRVTIEYWRPSTGEVVKRDVDVYGWAGRRGEWIFAGYCHLRKSVRVFYLSRIRKLKVNTVEKHEPDYSIPVEFDIRRWSRQQVWDYEVHPPKLAEVRFRGSLARMARQLLPTAKLTLEEDGSRYASLEVRNLGGLVRQALAWGLEAELVEPPEGRAMAREILNSFVGREAVNP